MKAIALFAFVALGACTTMTDRVRDRSVYVRLETTMGDIVFRLDSEEAPVSSANFLRYVDEGAYEGTIIHRVVPGFVIQGGGHTADLTELPGHDPIVNEWQNGLKNIRGSVGMARDEDPDSATRQWYINLADNDRLDIAREVSGNAGYAVFAHVVAGMDVVDRIAALPTHDREDLDLAGIPDEPVVVTRVSRADGP